MMNEVKDYYIRGEHYDWVSDPRLFERIFHNRREKQTVEVIEKYSRNSNVLDVGCGTGLITRHLKGNVVGLDINEWNLERAKKNVANAMFIQGDCEDLWFGSNSFDLIICTETLEHLPEPKKTLNEINRVLKDDGRLVVTVPSTSMIWKFRKHLTSTHPHSEPFHKNYSKKELRKLLSNFKVLEVKSIAYGLALIGVAEK